MLDNEKKKRPINHMAQNCLCLTFYCGNCLVSFQILWMYEKQLQDIIFLCSSFFFSF